MTKINVSGKILPTILDNLLYFLRLMYWFKKQSTKEERESEMEEGERDIDQEREGEIIHLLPHSLNINNILVSG